MPTLVQIGVKWLGWRNVSRCDPGTRLSAICGGDVWFAEDVHGRHMTINPNDAGLLLSSVRAWASQKDGRSFEFKETKGGFSCLLTDETGRTFQRHGAEMFDVVERTVQAAF